MIWCFLVATNVCDARNYAIPNQLIGLGYITGFYLSICSFGLSGIRVFCVNAIWPVLLLYLLFLLGGFGAGDIKVLSVIATMVGAATTLRVMIVSILLAGCVAILICIMEQKISRRKLHMTFYMTAAVIGLQLMEEI